MTTPQASLQDIREQLKQGIDGNIVIDEEKLTELETELLLRRAEIVEAKMKIEEENCKINKEKMQKQYGTYFTDYVDTSPDEAVEKMYTFMLINYLLWCTDLLDVKKEKELRLLFAEKFNLNWRRFVEQRENIPLNHRGKKIMSTQNAKDLIKNRPKILEIFEFILQHQLYKGEKEIKLTVEAQAVEDVAPL